MLVHDGSSGLWDRLYLHPSRCICVLQDRLKLHVHRSLPVACSLCSGTEVSTSGCPNLYHYSLQVFHGATSIRSSPVRLPTCSPSLLLQRLLRALCALRCGRCNVYCWTIRAVDLLPSRLKFQIFVDMPWRIRLATLAAPLQVCRTHSTT